MVVDRSYSLQLTVHYGRQLRDTDWVGQSDAYVQAQLMPGGPENRSPTVDNDCNPVWNWTCCFPYENQRFLDFRVYDYDVATADDFLGQAYLNLTKGENLLRKDLPLVTEKGKDAGMINVSVDWLVSVCLI